MLHDPKPASCACGYRDEAKARDLAADVGSGARGVGLADLAAGSKPLGHVLANSTSVGMHPHEDASPVPAAVLTGYELVFDAVYTPMETRLLKVCKCSCRTRILLFVVWHRVGSTVGEPRVSICRCSCFAGSSMARLCGYMVVAVHCALLSWSANLHSGMCFFSLETRSAVPCAGRQGGWVQDCERAGDVCGPGSAAVRAVHGAGTACGTS